jgi:hypothetical protein
MYIVKEHFTPEYVPMEVDCVFVGSVRICKYSVTVTENMDGCICGLLEFA